MCKEDENLLSLYPLRVDIRSNRVNRMQGRFRLGSRTNYPTIMKNKLRSRLPLCAGGVQSLEVFKSRSDEWLLQTVYYSSSHFSTRK